MYAKTAILNFDLDDEDFVPIDLDLLSAASVLAQCRTSVDVLIVFGESLEPYFTLKKGKDFQMDVRSIKDPIFWAKSGDGEAVLEVIVYECKT